MDHSTLFDKTGEDSSDLRKMGSGARQIGSAHGRRSFIKSAAVAGTLPYVAPKVAFASPRAQLSPTTDLFADTFARLKTDLDTAIDGHAAFSTCGPDAAATRAHLIEARTQVIGLLGVFQGLTGVVRVAINIAAADDLAALGAQLPILEAGISHLPRCDTFSLAPSDLCDSLYSLRDSIALIGTMLAVIGGIIMAVPGAQPLGLFLFGAGLGMDAAAVSLGVWLSLNC